ncbi:hypothetical protein [Humisphaera borealis]|uniref:Uncharacterized protein n=1 Tax=Humisphaera borealis TaxID=2807512 RepID=A0A7M2X196_9BACT|nr:hypothetical protein [Humisphaera borealis]QOV90891.1 hypothetical protein IPV69_05895 [Humisphaera borealis]
MSYPNQADVREGVFYGESDELEGSLQLPPQGEVRYGFPYGGGGGTEASGQLVLPAIADVRAGVTYGYVGEFTGNVVLPEVANVQSGTNYGSFDGSTYQYVGEYTGGGHPNQTDVRSGTVFGNGSEYTGSLVVPAASDVRDGVAFDVGLGNLTLPQTTQVSLGVSYGGNGTEYTGTAPDLASLTSTVNSILVRTPDYKPSVNTGGEIRASVVNGDVNGRILGTGSGTISGVGVRAVDSSGNAIAPAATALSTSNWTGARAGYLDKLNVTGTLAHTDNANTFKADVSSLATASAVAALPSSSTIATAAAAAILASPSNKLTTNGSGYVTTTNPGSGASAGDIATAILATPANKLVTNSDGQVETSNPTIVRNVTVNVPS